MNIEKLECPNCGAPLDYNDDHSATVTIICQFCRTVIVVPKELRTIEIPVEPIREPTYQEKYPIVSPPKRTFEDITFDEAKSCLILPVSLVIIIVITLLIVNH